MKTFLPNVLLMAFLLAATLLFSATNAKAQDHLLLTEITLAPDSGEFIEIYNPTANSISLDNYYLADNANYALIAGGTMNVISSDFVVKFPAGHNILPNQVVVVAMKGDYFSNYYGVGPDFEIINQSGSIVDMDTIKTGSNPTLTNGGEGIVLFYWDGVSDLVSDVDIINAGVPTSTNQITPKTGLMVNNSTYLPDAGTMPLQASAPAIGFSTKRIMPEGNNETLTGGNGITGNDETTENILVTWDTSGIAPNPGFVDFTTNIYSITKNNQLILYPNPTHGIINVKFNFVIKNARVSIVNILGEIIFEEEITHSTEIAKLNMEKLNKGIYFLHVEEGNIRYSNKIILK